MKEIAMDMETLSFLVEFGYTDIITTTPEGFTNGELLYVYEFDKQAKIKVQITTAQFLKKRKSGLLLFHLTISYIV